MASKEKVKNWKYKTCVIMCYLTYFCWLPIFLFSFLYIFSVKISTSSVLIHNVYNTFYNSDQSIFKYTLNDSLINERFLLSKLSLFSGFWFFFPQILLLSETPNSISTLLVKSLRSHSDVWCKSETNDLYMHDFLQLALARWLADCITA